MTLKTLALSALLVVAGCAHSVPGLVDAEFWYKDCRPYSFPKGLPTITPNSPGSTTMAEAEAPKRAMIHRSECARLGSFQVVDLIPSKDPGITPSVVGDRKMLKFDLRDVAPPFGPAK